MDLVILQHPVKTSQGARCDTGPASAVSYLSTWNSNTSVSIRGKFWT